MCRGEYEKKWMAYLDGDLSAGEASAFVGALDTAAHERIEAELHLEAALSEKLREPERCPDALWLNTLQQLESTQRRNVVSYPFKVAFWTLAASCIMTTALTFAYLVGSSNPVQMAANTEDSQAQVGRLRITEISVKGFALRAQTGASPEAIEEYLRKHDIGLMVAPHSPGQAAQQVRLLGSCLGNYPKGEIVEILLDCNGTPAKLVLARMDSSGARLIRNGQELGTVARTKVIGNYVAGVVASAETPEISNNLLDMITIREDPQDQKKLNPALSTSV